MPCVQEEEEDSLHPTQCFLQNLDYPEDEDSPIDLQQTAVAVMSHLDRLARPLLRADREARVNQGLMVRGEAGEVVRAALASHGLVSAAWSGSTLYWVTAGGSVHWLQGDQVETLDTSGISEARVVEVVCTQGGLTLLTSSGELWTSDLPDPSLHLLTPGLLGRRVT